MTFSKIASSAALAAILSASFSVVSAQADYNGNDRNFGAYVQQQKIINAKILQERANRNLLILQDQGNWNGEDGETPDALTAFQRTSSGHSNAGPILEQIGDHNGGDVARWRNEN